MQFSIELLDVGNAPRLAARAHPAVAFSEAGTMRRFLAGMAAAMAISGLATAAQAALQDENLLLPLPPGFSAGWQGHQGSETITEYVPAGESVDAWSQMVTQQIFHGRANVPPDGLPTFMSGVWKTVCPGGAVQKLGEAAENGYPAVIWSFACPRNPQTGKPENAWIKVIGGSDSLYSVQYAIRSDITAAAARSALAYLQRVTVCDTRGAAHPCPSGM
jgi:hypothetical protein